MIASVFSKIRENFKNNWQISYVVIKNLNIYPIPAHTPFYLQSTRFFLICYSTNVEHHGFYRIFMGIIKVGLLIHQLYNHGQFKR